MKHSFSKQAAEVKRLSKLVLKVDQEILREATISGGLDKGGAGIL